MKNIKKLKRVKFKKKINFANIIFNYSLFDNFSL